MKGSLIKRLASNNVRTANIQNNVLYSILIKGFSLLTTLMVISLTLKMLSVEGYGIWITIYSIITWFNMMDLGIGNGFRNKFAKAVALKDKALARTYVQTLYSSTSIISAILFLIVLVTHEFMDFHAILNLTADFDENVGEIFLIAFGLFGVQLTLKNINTIFLALQKNAVSDFITLLGNVVVLVALYVLFVLGTQSLFVISLVYMLSPIIVSLIASMWAFYTILSDYKPQRFSVDVSRFKELMSLGLQFFIIQIATVVMFSTGNILVAQLFGAKEVVPYNISFRLFSTLMVVFTILIAPLWSAYTEAWVIKDIAWIQKSLKRSIQVWFLFALLACTLYILAPLVYRLWIGDVVTVPKSLSLAFMVYCILLAWNAIFSQFLNGIGVIKVQMYMALIQCIINIPLGIFLANAMGVGSAGIVWAINFNLSMSAIVLYFQVQHILSYRRKYG